MTPDEKRSEENDGGFSLFSGFRKVSLSLLNLGQGEAVGLLNSISERLILCIFIDSNETDGAILRHVDVLCISLAGDRCTGLSWSNVGDALTLKVLPEDIGGYATILRDMETHVTEVDVCRSCGNPDLDEILSLGEQYVSDFIDSPDDQTVKAPLELVLCNAETGGCGLLQLKHTVDPEYLYREYWYKSGINESMRESLREIVTDAQDIANLNPDDIVLDIGCNDGTMLRMFNEKYRRIGFEPAENLVEEARGDTSRVINDFFNAESYKAAVGEESASLITSIAMFYDLDEPNEFVEDIKSILADDGVWVIQMAYLPRKLKTNAFDSIVHEHLEYYSLLALENLLDRHGFEAFDMETNDVNGGSFRVYIQHVGAGQEGFEGAAARLDSYRDQEREMGLHHRKTYEDFAKRVEELKSETRRFIEEKVEEGKKVYVYGASTKGNTLLQYYELDNSLIEAAAERNPDKYGKMTVGTHIPIVPEEEAREEADYFLALPWHFMDVFLQRESEFLKEGGKFIRPLPEFEVISAEDVPGLE